MTSTRPNDSVTPSASRRSSSRSISVSVSRLGWVYQSSSNGSTSARRVSRSSSRTWKRAPQVQVDRTRVKGRERPRRLGGPEHLAAGAIDDRERAVRRRAQRDLAGGVALAAAQDELAVLGAQLAEPLEPLEVGERARAEELGVAFAERALVGGAQQVREVDLLGLVVEDRGLHRAIEEVVGVAREELVERVLAGDVERQAAPSPAGAAPHLAQAGDRAGEGDDDRRVERADVDSQLERVGGHHRAQLARRSAAASISRRCAGV